MSRWELIVLEMREKSRKMCFYVKIKILAFVDCFCLFVMWKSGDLNDIECVYTD